MILCFQIHFCVCEWYKLPLRYIKLVYFVFEKKTDQTQLDVIVLFGTRLVVSISSFTYMTATPMCINIILFEI